MQDFRENEILLQAGYYVMVISPPAGATGNFLTVSERATMTF